MLRDRGMKSVVHEKPISVRLPSSLKMWGSPNRQKAKALKYSTRSCVASVLDVEPRMLSRLLPPHAAHAAQRDAMGSRGVCNAYGAIWEHLSGHCASGPVEGKEIIKEVDVEGVYQRTPSKPGLNPAGGIESGFKICVKTRSTA